MRFHLIRKIFFTPELTKEVKALIEENQRKVMLAMLAKF
jgi:hypothetical protein